ncbi:MULTISPECIES: ATP-binding protein [Haloferax]|uniref:Chemotaxis protein CheA n=2 Tax=Haloferax TaxID=2251 RepID=A0A6G1YY30_9EURY|nr:MULTISPECIES: ATP-binding protein [Haloferax]KAB1186631.1 hypothetical protein Hfx1149_00725 [Haloferax sp. CBA1149]MRW79249.1 hypothetical protein [Haloferax marinisediminis]
MSRNDEFVRETRTSVRQLTNGLVELERDGSSRELVDDLFRTAHTLKGNCSMAGLDGASRLAHAVEDFLSGLRDGSLGPNPDLIDAALAAVDDIDAILDEWADGDTVETDPESSVSALRTEMERYRGDPGASDEMASRDADAPSPESMPDPDTAEFDPTVVDALESASGFDDLEGLLAEMDDPDVDEDEAQSRWGTFDKRDADDPSAGHGSAGSSQNEFDAIKSGVDTDDVSSLDRELVETEFGEFDDDDQLSIQDLIEGEVAGPDVEDEDADQSDDADATADSSSSTVSADADTANDAIRPEDFGYTAATSSASDDTPVSADEGASETPAGATASGADAANPFEGADVVDPDEDPADDGVSVAGESDVATEQPASTESVDADLEREGEDDAEISFPDGKSFDPESEESSASEEPALGFSADNASEASDDSPDDFEEFDDAPDPLDDVSDEFDLPDEGADGPGHSEEITEDDLSGEFGDDSFDLADDDQQGDISDEDLGIPEDFLSGGIDLDVGQTANDSASSADDAGLSVERGVEGLDLPDIDLPDVDELSGASLADEFDGNSAADVSFERDEHTMAFESRFAERFGGSVGDDDVQLLQVASSTIEESSLDAARYQSSGTASYPPDFGDTRETDQIQSLTVDVQNADSLLNLVEELSLTQLRIKQSDGEDIDDHLSVMDSVTAELRRAVMNLRLMPLSTAIDGLPRVVRDIARKQDKQVSYEVSDEGVNLDRSIVEKLGDPLVHLVRNAVDHGIEPPEERTRQGKKPEGTVELRARRDREHVVIEVEDDGRGISAERIRQQAIDNDIISRERAERMSFDEVYDLVFEPGFSTADEVTDVSGRGVGMDAVRRTINSLEGTVELTSESGSGTTVRIRLPVSIAVAKMLFVRVGHEQYAIPASAVEDVEIVDEDSLSDDGLVAVDWPEHVTDRPDRIPLLRLGKVLGVEDAASGSGTTDSTDNQSGASESTAAGTAQADKRSHSKRVLVRLDPATRELALLCDEVDDAREVVVKPYEKLLGDVPGISGATMSGDGTLVNIVDVTTL